MVDQHEGEIPDGSDDAPEDGISVGHGMDMPSQIDQAEHLGRGTFDRSLSPTFIGALRDEAKKPGWWADVLADRKLLVALRGEYLNVYYKGQSLFRVTLQGSKLQVTTHEKFLLDPALSSQVRFEQGEFDVEKLLEVGFIRRYEGSTTLQKMKKACSYYSGLEKAGCHEIAIGNPTVIDCEIAFSGFKSPDDGIGYESGRVDLACLEAFGAEARLVFWEAKHYSNKELRADLKSLDSMPPVVAQLKKYQVYLSENRNNILDSYMKMAQNWVDIHGMSASGSSSSLITEVGMGKRKLVFGDKPQVGLIVFGFDAAQRDNENWVKHRMRLINNIADVHLVGDAKKLRLPAGL